MIRSALAILALAALAGPAAPRPAGAVRITPDASAREIEVESFEAAGVPVLLERLRANQVVAAQLFIRGGAGDLTPQTAGIENLLFRVSLRETERYSKDAFAARLAATGSSITGAPGYDDSVFALRTVREGWNEAWDLFTQALLHPTLPADEVELARSQLVNAVRRRRDDPDAFVKDLSDSLFYRGHPYALNPEGTEAGLAGIGADQLREWHRRRLTKENLLLVVVGDVTRADLEGKVAKAFASLPERGDTGHPVEPVAPGAAAVSVTERALPTTYVRGYFPAPALSDADDYAALTVASSILSDRFFEEVRTKRNLAYAVLAGVSSRRANYGLLYVSSVDPDSAVAVMLREVRRLKDEPVPSEVLAQAVNVFVTQYYLGLETNESQAALLGRYEILGGGWRRSNEFVDEVRRVTPEDVQRVTRRYVSGLHFAVLGSAAGVDRALFTSM